MTQDKSREKSLLFLLTTVSRSLEAPPENKTKIRESIGSLQIEDSDEKWVISIRLDNGVRKQIEITKDRFIFYPVKSAARYETNPAILNRNSAQEVLLFLFSEYRVQIPGKRIHPVKRPLSDFIPFNLISSSLFSLLALSQFGWFGIAVVISQMYVSTRNHHISMVRRGLLILGVAVPIAMFLFRDAAGGNGVNSALSQIALILLFDLLIRVESEQKYGLYSAVSKVIALMGLIVINVLQENNQVSVILISLIVVNGYVILRSGITSSVRNILVLSYLLLFTILIVIAIVANPYRLLLLPYVIYVAIYETLFGDNRNPTKLTFGAVCLTI